MPTGRVRLYDVIQGQSSTSMVRPPQLASINPGAVRLFLSPSTFDDLGVYQANLNNGNYSFVNANTAIQRKLDLSNNSQAFFRVDAGSNLSESLFRSVRINETAFRSMGNVNFDLFRIDVNEDAYLTKAKVLEAIVIPELVRDFLESLRIEVEGIPFDLINEAEIERIFGNMVDSISNFDISFTRDGRLRLRFNLTNIRIHIPALAINAVAIAINGRTIPGVCSEYIFQQLNVDLYLKVNPNRTITTNDQINFDFDDAQITIPNGTQMRGCPPANDNSNTAPNWGQWSVVVEETQQLIRDMFRLFIEAAVATALSPIGSTLMRYVNLEMESQFDRMMDTVITETMARYDDLIDVNRNEITKTISHFTTTILRRTNGNGVLQSEYALKPVFVYGVLTSSPGTTMTRPRR